MSSGKCQHTRKDYTCRKDNCNAIGELSRETSKTSKGELKFRAWKTRVEKTVEDMERANADGEIKKIYKLVNIITGNPLKSPINLTTDARGNLLQTPEEVASTWKQFLIKKIHTTTAEREPTSHLRGITENI